MRCEKQHLEEEARAKEKPALASPVPRFTLNIHSPGPEILVSAYVDSGMCGDRSWITQIDRAGNLRQEMMWWGSATRAPRVEMSASPSPLTTAQMDQLRPLLDRQDGDRLQALMRTHVTDDAEFIRLLVHDRKVEAELSLYSDLGMYLLLPETYPVEFEEEFEGFRELWEFIDSLSPYPVPETWKQPPVRLGASR